LRKGSDKKLPVFEVKSALISPKNGLKSERSSIESSH